MRTILTITFVASLSLAFLLMDTLIGGHALLRAQSPESADAGPNFDSGSLAKRIQTNTDRLDRIEESDKQVRQMLASIPQPSAEDLDKELKQHLLLQAQLAELEKAFDALPPTNPAKAASVADLEKQLSDAQTERDRMAKREADVHAALTQTKGTKGLRNETVLENLIPVLITLVGNRFVPMLKPFYSVEKRQMRSTQTGEVVDVAVISRVRDGEAVDKTIRSGGLLDALLSKLDPKKHYFRFLVCADAIAAFQTVSDVVSKRGFAYSWDTAKDKVLVVPIPSGGQTNPNTIQDRGYLPLGGENK